MEVPVPGFGAMGISFALGNKLSYEEAEPVLLKALELVVRSEILLWV